MKNPSSGSQVVPGTQTDMVKLIIAFHNFPIALKDNRIITMSRVHVHQYLDFTVFIKPAFNAPLLIHQAAFLFGSADLQISICIMLGIPNNPIYRYKYPLTFSVLTFKWQ